MKRFVTVTLLATLSAGMCFAQGTIQQSRQALRPSDIEALSRQAARNNAPSTEEQQKSLMAVGAIGLDQTYFDPAWQPGELTLADGQSRSIPTMRLNMLGQVVEVMDPTLPGGVKRYPVEQVAAFKTGSHRFEKLSYHSTTGDGKNFMEPLNSGRIRLLLLHETILIPAVRNEAVAIEIKPATYQRSVRLFSQTTGQAQPVETGLTKRQLLRLMGDQNKAVETYATAHNIQWTDLSGALQLVDYYNNLVAQGAPGK
jgi:hypothetical protein